MGLQLFKKKAVDPSGTPQSTFSDRTKKWTPGRRKATTATPSTEAASTDSKPATMPPPPPSTTILNNLSVMALDDVEVVTFESQRALMDQREAIRKKLFENQTSPSNSLNLLESVSVYQEDSMDDDNYDDFVDAMEKSTARFHRFHRSITDRNYSSTSTPRTANEASKEIFANGMVKDTVMYKTKSSPASSSPSDRFSLPLEAVSRSWSMGGESLQQIAEDPVDYGTPLHDRVTGSRNRPYTGPISVDVSYTDSELASIATERPPPALLIAPTVEIVTPSPASHASFMNSTDTTNSAIRLLQGTIAADSMPQQETPCLTSPLVSEADDIDAYVDPEAVETSFTGPSTSSRRGVTIPFYGKLMAASTPDVIAMTSIVVSPALSTQESSHNISMQSGVTPMDERETDHELEDFLNSGKSPLKGMPDDERMEYQKDEMVASPVLSREPLPSDDAVQIPEIALNQIEEANGRTVEPNQEEHSDDPNILSEHTSYSMGTTSGATSTSYGDTTRTSSAMVPELARSIMLAAFQCGSGALDNATATMNSCGGKVVPSSVFQGATSSATMDVHDVTASHTVRDMFVPNEALPESSSHRRVYLDESSTVRFLRRITNNGFVLLYLQPINDDYLISETDVPTDDWKGNTVTMMIQKGCISAVPGSTSGVSSDNMDVSIEAPRLEWITVTGGTVSDAKTTSVYLLDIQSILTNDGEKEEDEDMCFFTITDGYGDVHIFEAATLEERNRIVHGLKTIIARWSFHLIAGDITATSELYKNHSSSMNLDEDMPSLPNPSQTMNLVSHMLLDTGG